MRSVLNCPGTQASHVRHRDLTAHMYAEHLACCRVPSCGVVDAEVVVKNVWTLMCVLGLGCEQRLSGHRRFSSSGGYGKRTSHCGFSLIGAQRPPSGFGFRVVACGGSSPGSLCEGLGEGGSGLKRARSAWRGSPEDLGLHSAPHAARIRMSIGATGPTVNAQLRPTVNAGWLGPRNPARRTSPVAPLLVRMRAL